MAKIDSTQKIRYAVVGLGHIAQVAILPAFQNAENSELAALVSDDEIKRKELGRRYGVNQTYSYAEYEQCLSSGVDAVYITLPNHLHKEYSVRAARAGVHVLCEKPMAVTVEECEAMIQAANESHVKLMIAYRLHFEEGNLTAVELARQGKLGDLRFFTSEFAQQLAENNIRVSHSPAEGGGTVYDMGVYCINAARYLFGEEPLEVVAASSRKPEERFSKSDQMTSVIMRFPEERQAVFTCSFGAAPISRYTLIGTEGAVTLDPAYEYAEPIGMQLAIKGKKTEKEFPKRDQFAPELIYFSDCILNDKEPEPSGEEGLADVKIVQAIYQSAEALKPVRLEIPARKQRPSLAQEIHKPAVQQPKPVHAKSPTGEAA
ncbi:MAG TPA: Gfo/Idh/MocA family oxidoreductase [Candidatus Angelobacter sp.]|nr:Gfo/Idh/MocA family oxidoreductase [Candidatus Angelobacter sp.]